MPNFLNLLAAHNEKNGITATFSEMKKTARRMDRIYAEHEEARNAIDPLAYVLDYSDETGEIATDNVLAERAKQNAANAARRIGARA